jgi:putative transposase
MVAYGASRRHGGHGRSSRAPQAQQARNACWELAAASRRPTVLVRDRDAKFAPAFDAVFAAEGVRVVRTPVRAPRANAFAERRVGTVRRECLDWLLIFDARHLQQVLRGYAEHYNRARPHRGRGLHPPLGPSPPHPSNSGPVCRRDRLGGLLHEYERVAA